MAELTAITFDRDIMNAMRAILNDLDDGNVLFDDTQIQNELRSHRGQIFFRDPRYGATGLVTGVFPYFNFGGRVSVNATDPFNSLLQAEGDKRSYQCKPAFRYWDSQAAITIYKNGVLQDPTVTAQAYTVNHMEGRISFTNTDIGDWESVNGCWSFYPVYHVARALWASILASSAGTMTIKIGNFEVDKDGIRDRIKMLDVMIKEHAQKNVRMTERIY